MKKIKDIIDDKIVEELQGKCNDLQMQSEIKFLIKIKLSF